MKYTQIVYEVKPQTFHFRGRSGPLGNSGKSDLFGSNPPPPPPPPPRTLLPPFFAIFRLKKKGYWDLWSVDMRP